MPLDPAASPYAHPPHQIGGQVSHAGQRRIALASLVQCGDARVGEQEMARVTTEDKHIVRLHVAVNNPTLARVVDGAPWFEGVRCATGRAGCSCMTGNKAATDAGFGDTPQWYMLCPACRKPILGVSGGVASVRPVSVPSRFRRVRDSEVASQANEAGTLLWQRTPRLIGDLLFVDLPPAFPFRAATEGCLHHFGANATNCCGHTFC